MKKINFKGTLIDKKVEHKFKLSLFSFLDDGSKIIYSPALDLSGYGKNESEAKQSFEEAFEAFVTYTTNKGTLLKVLAGLGWQVEPNLKKTHKPAKAPELAQLLKTNDYLANIFETKNFKKYNEEVALPV